MNVTISKFQIFGIASIILGLSNIDSRASEDRFYFRPVSSYGSSASAVPSPNAQSFSLEQLKTNLLYPEETLASLTSENVSSRIQLISESIAANLTSGSLTPAWEVNQYTLWNSDDAFWSGISGEPSDLANFLAANPKFVHAFTLRAVRFQVDDETSVDITYNTSNPISDSSKWTSFSSSHGIPKLNQRTGNVNIYSNAPFIDFYSSISRENDFSFTKQITLNDNQGQLYKVITE